MHNYISAVDLARIIASKNRLTIKDARKIINQIFEAISDGMAEGKETWIPNFGKFGTIQKPARMVRNPSKNCMVWREGTIAPMIKWSSCLYNH